MGEIVGLAALIVVLVFGAAGLAYSVASGRHRAALDRTPLDAIDSADRQAVLAKTRQYFRHSQASVRLMESLVNDDMVVAVLPEEKRRQMQALIDEFYEV